MSRPNAHQFDFHQIRDTWTWHVAFVCFKVCCARRLPIKKIFSWCIRSRIYFRFVNEITICFSFRKIPLICVSLFL